MPRWRSLYTRIEGLEDRLPPPAASAVSGIASLEEEERRERVRGGLERIAYLRRSDSPEARTEVEEIREALERRKAELTGGGR